MKKMLFCKIYCDGCNVQIAPSLTMVGARVYSATLPRVTSLNIMNGYRSGENDITAICYWSVSWPLTHWVIQYPFGFWKQLQTHTWFKTTSFALIFPLIPGTLLIFSPLCFDWLSLGSSQDHPPPPFFKFLPFISVLSLCFSSPALPFPSPYSLHWWSKAEKAEAWGHFPPYQYSRPVTRVGFLTLKQGTVLYLLAFLLSYPHTDINVQQAHWHSISWVSADLIKNLKIMESGKDPRY